MVAKSFLTSIERFFLKRALHRSIHANHHFDVVQDIIKDVLAYWHEAFPEVNQVTLEHHLSNAIDSALASGHAPMSYRDVVVYAGGHRYELAGDYSMQLRCSKTCGWQLWKIWDDNAVLMGGEFDSKPLRIEIGGVVILDNNQMLKAA